MSKYNSIIRHFKGRRLLVIGDAVLDRYIKGSVSRISPEAPVPIVLQEESFYTPGGAANVANNLASLGADVTLVAKIGDDIEGGILKREHLIGRAVLGIERFLDEYLDDFRRGGRELAGIDFAGSAVDGEEVAFLVSHAVHGHGPGGVINLQCRRAANANQPVRKRVMSG